MDDLLNNPNPWILTIGSSVIAAVISHWVIQRLGQKRNKKPEKLHTDGQLEYQETIQEPSEENKIASNVWGTVGSCLGMVALTIAYIALIYGLRQVEKNIGNTGVVLLCCLPSLLGVVVLAVMTLREEDLI